MKIRSSVPSVLGAALFLALPADVYALGALADLTVFDRQRQQTLPVYEQDGHYYVAGKPGNEYELRLNSRCGRDVLAVVSVDGVNVVTGESAAWQQSGYVLDGWSDMAVRGWRKSLERTAAFYFTSHRNSYATRTGRPRDVGVIGVAIFESRHDQAALQEEERFGADDRPADAESAGAASRSGVPQAESAPTRSKQQVGTGHGRSERSVVRYASFERASEQPAEVVIIRYDSHRNLVARGVIPADDRRAVPAPNPFPGDFVPDPGR